MLFEIWFDKVSIYVYGSDPKNIMPKHMQNVVTYARGRKKTRKCPRPPGIAQKFIERDVHVHVGMDIRRPP